MQEKTKNIKTAVLVLLLSFASSSLAHKGVEPFDLKEWRRVEFYYTRFNDSIFTEIPYSYIQKNYHHIYDKVELTLSHFPIITNGFNVDHSKRGYIVPTVLVKDALDPQKTIFVFIMGYYIHHFKSTLIVKAEGPELIDSYFEFIEYESINESDTVDRDEK